MKSITNDCDLIPPYSKQLIFPDNKKEKKHLYFNILNAISSVSHSFQELLFSQTIKSGTPSHNGIFSRLKEILSSRKNLLLKENDNDLDKKYISGHEIIIERDNIIQERAAKHRPLGGFYLSSKTAVIGGLILAGGATAEAVVDFRRFTDLRTFPSNHSASDYLVYDSNHINSRDYNVPHKVRHHHDVNNTISYDTVSLEKMMLKHLRFDNKNLTQGRIRHTLIYNNILKIIRDKNIDWRTRDELYLIIKLAERSTDVKRIKSLKKRNIMLLIKCIELARTLLYDKDRYLLHKESDRAGKIIMRRLCRLINNMNKNNKIITWQMLIERGIIADGTPIQRLTDNIISLTSNNIDKETHENNKHVDFIVSETHDMRKEIKRTQPVLNRDDIESKYKLYYIEKADNVEKNEPSNNHPSYDDVKIVSMIKCRNERENLRISDILRIVSRTMKNTISEVINEGLIIYQYDYLGEGCKDDKDLYDISKKIEDVINNFLSLHPEFGTLRLGIQITAGLLDLMADDIDGQDLLPEKIANIDDDLKNLFKGIISSITSEQLSDFNKKIDNIQPMLENFKFNNGKLSIKTEDAKEQIEIKEIYNHFANKKNGNFLFYSKENNWVVNDDVKFSQKIKETLDKAEKAFPDEKDMIFIKNSSPEFYQDAIIINNGKQLFILVDDQFRYVREIKFNNLNYRYLMDSSINLRDFEDSIPVVYQGGQWCPEDKTSRAVSNEFLEYLESNDNINSKLVSKHIKHIDVSPMTLGRDIQVDKYNNRYIKINDRYFLLRMDNAGSIYIEGKTNILFLTKIRDRYYPREDRLEGLFAVSKTELITPLIPASNAKYFLDNSVVIAIARHDFWNSGLVGRKIDAAILAKILYSDVIAGAINFENEHYFSYYEHLIKVTNNGDDTYTLHSAADANKNIVIYKNINSNTYYLLTGKDRFKNKIIKSHCITKRQVLDICGVVHHETSNFNSLLNTNLEYAVTIDNHEQILKPSNLVSGVYKNKENDLFYHFKDDKYFHCVEEDGVQEDVTPAFISIYGKKDNDDIDFSIFISKVSVIKDFDTKEIIMSTPLEAQELVLNIDVETSLTLLEWQKNNFHGVDITLSKLRQLPSALMECQEFNDVQSLICHGGKKNLLTVSEINRRLDIITSTMSEDYDGANLLSLESISHGFQPAHIPNIFNSAFNRALTELSKATLAVTSLTASMHEYIKNTLSISDMRARSFLIEALRIKLKRMSIILDENDKNNIMILIGNNKSPSINKDFISIPDGLSVGYTLADDPLDRLILNALFIPDNFDPNVNPELGSKQEEYFINIAKETMLHEAVHATGATADYIYIGSDDIGRLEPIEDALARIEWTIGKGRMREEFIYLSKIYFSHNPVYHQYRIENLMLPKNLQQIYIQDDFFKTLLVLNNPDTLAILVRDIALLT